MHRRKSDGGDNDILFYSTCSRHHLVGHVCLTMPTKCVWNDFKPTSNTSIV